jgi:hypothetical protein
MQDLQCSAEVVQQLHGLSGLRTLLLGITSNGEVCGAPQVTDGRFSAIGQLTGLRELDLQAPDAPEGLLPQLAQLKQLTRLSYVGMLDGIMVCLDFGSEDTVRATDGPRGRVRVKVGRGAISGGSSTMMLSSSLAHINQSINQCYTCSYEAQKAHASHSLISRR